ncbi:DUF6781 family protein [Methylomarinum sp. Ch1-1]|uniref:DUF6781 family protein n=1 Tax=Methylomarinum roseum TaxID=3067653 RepID=A0AAU7NRL8_9GAMM|nr:DUF6781 family protein [Methylomarinum sp. Ch1-1]MDP4520373.1 hypothetical protein [Methylomarinum sp. Ch1-1]
MNDTTTQQVENTVREAVESGEDIYQKVRSITLKALTERELDRDNIADVVQAVGEGIRTGMGAQYETSRTAFQESTQALDDALASTAEATKLAVEEAASRMDEFSRTDLKRTTDDLKGLEELFLETMGNIAKDSQGVMSDVVRDFISHAQTKGTAVGKQAELVLDRIKHVVLSGEHSALSSARETTSTLARIGSGFLAGIAESLQSESGKK